MAAAASTTAAAAGTGPAAPALRFTDIAVNLASGSHDSKIDGMFRGEYHGKQCHEPDVQRVLARAAAAGVHRIVITGTSLDESRAALALARQLNAAPDTPAGLRLYSTVGIHPTQTKELDALSPAQLEAHEAALLEVARDGLSDGTVVAIGECGLDGDRTNYSPWASQLRHFVPLHTRLARETGLPMFLHDRATKGEFMRQLAAAGGAPAGGVVHSFTGTLEELQALLAVPGLYVGINGCSLKDASNGDPKAAGEQCRGACDVAARVPLERLLLETDAPWCGIKASSPAAKHISTAWPSVKKERYAADALVRDRCEPCQVVQVAEALAGLMGVPLATVAEAAERNAEALFRFRA